MISGLPLEPAALAELATRLKKLCGAGGAVKNGVIEIQGDHRERLVAELSSLASRQTVRWLKAPRAAASGMLRRR